MALFLRQVKSTSFFCCCCCFCACAQKLDFSRTFVKHHVEGSKKSNLVELKPGRAAGVVVIGDEMFCSHIAFF
uniref:Putative secreted protein n=1 Tax=Ixodes ricinus TaxID=34613 RepID=A0A6B0TSM4_IXORI